MTKTVRTTLDERNVKALKPQAKSYYAMDAKVIGFGVRVTPNSVKTFVLRYRFHGRQRWHKIGLLGDDTVISAREYAKDLKSRIRLGDDPEKERMDRLDRAKGYSIERIKRDNILIGRSWRDSQNTPQLFTLMVQKGIELIERFIPAPQPYSHHQINNNLSANGQIYPHILAEHGAIPFLNWSSHYFKDLEVYWDVQHENAIGFVHHLSPNIMSVAETFSYTSYPPAPGRDGASNSVKIALPNNMELIV